MQLRLTGFDVDKLGELGRRIRDLYAGGRPEADRVVAAIDDTYVDDFATAVTGKLGGKVGIACRGCSTRSWSMCSSGWRSIPNSTPAPMRLIVAETEMSDVERNAAALTPDDIVLDDP